jgi:beta-lactam-binding protein with PASTA domain
VTANNGTGTVSVLLNATGRCVVPDVVRTSLPAAKRVLARENCRLGTTRRAYSKSFDRGLVISEKPKPVTVLPKGSKINLVVSRGRKH